MAWLQTDPSGNFHVSFRFGGQKFKGSLKTKNEQEAQGRKQRLEENIRFVESGRLEIPRDGDIPTFLLSDGKLQSKVMLSKGLMLKEVFDEFFGKLPVGNLEDSTVRCMETHRRHLMDYFGGRFVVQKLTLDDLQGYVAKRSGDAGLRGRNVGGNTMSKEIATFRSVWNWAVDAGKLQGEFPKKGLRLSLLDHHFSYLPASVADRQDDTRDDRVGSHVFRLSSHAKRIGFDRRPGVAILVLHVCFPSLASRRQRFVRL